MQLRSIGFLPLLMTIMMGALFILKFHTESQRTEYALRLQNLIDESKFDGAVTWKTRRENYFHALTLLSEARAKKIDLDKLLEQVMTDGKIAKAYAPVLTDGLLKNLAIAEEFDLLTEENLARLENGQRLVIGAGGFEGEQAVLDNIIPFRYSPELEMRFANLLLKPESIVRRHPDQIGEGALATMSACRNADMMSEISYERAMRQMRRARSL